MQILILEDNLDRQRLMEAFLRDRFPQYSVQFFNAVAPLLETMADPSHHDDIALLAVPAREDRPPREHGFGSGEQDRLPGHPVLWRNCELKRKPLEIDKQRACMDEGIVERVGSHAYLSRGDRHSPFR
jgi:hypothetical protein